MTQASARHRGHCFCGAVRFTVDAEPTWSGICHCDSCRRATGGILMAAASFPRGAVRFEGAERRFFDSSPGVRRGFCGACGTALSYENERWPDDINLMLANFEDPGRIRPAMQIFTAGRLPWLHVVDDLPRYPGEPVPGTEER